LLLFLSFLSLQSEIKRNRKNKLVARKSTFCLQYDGRVKNVESTARASVLLHPASRSAAQ
jgi:hypothetical protein